MRESMPARTARAFAFALALCGLAATGAQAQVSIPAGGVPTPPTLTRHVTDLSGTLQASEQAGLEQQLVELEQRKGSQLAILIVPSTGDTPIEQYALQVAENTKLGRMKIDDGLLLLVAKDDHKARIEVGYGLEGVVTDAIASRVIREYLAPKFRQEDYAGGLRDATGVLVKLVDGEPLPAPLADEPKARDSGGSIPFAVFVGLFVGMFAGATRLKPLVLRRVGAGAAAAGLAWLLFSVGLSAIIAAVVAFLVSAAGGGRFGSGRGNFGIFPGGGWGGGGFGGGGGGGGWSGGGGSFGGGGASGGW